MYGLATSEMDLFKFKKKVLISKVYWYKIRIWFSVKRTKFCFVLSIDQFFLRNYK